MEATYQQESEDALTARLRKHQQIPTAYCAVSKSFQVTAAFSSLFCPMGYPQLWVECSGNLQSFVGHFHSCSQILWYGDIRHALVDFQDSHLPFKSSEYVLRLSILKLILAFKPFRPFRQHSTELNSCNVFRGISIECFEQHVLEEIFKNFSMLIMILFNHRPLNALNLLNIPPLYVFTYMKIKKNALRVRHICPSLVRSVQPANRPGRNLGTVSSDGGSRSSNLIQNTHPTSL